MYEDTNIVVILFEVRFDLAGGKVMTQFMGKLTRDLQSCCFTLLCEEWAFASLGFAAVLPTVRMTYGNYFISVAIMCLNFTHIMVPQIFPSRGHIDHASEGDGLSGEHLVKV